MAGQRLQLAQGRLPDIRSLGGRRWRVINIWVVKGTFEYLEAFGLTLRAYEASFVRCDACDARVRARAMLARARNACVYVQYAHTCSMRALRACAEQAHECDVFVRVRMRACVCVVCV
eukprot:6178575-Pleurochrysis_carterae.AAC.7